MSVLQQVKSTLPAHWYFDPGHYERELTAVWYRDWVCVGREESLRAPGDYLVAALGNQSVIVTRSATGELRAFHNTCRHRGSVLCTESAGRFRNGRIVCPYHTWTYSTDGRLLATPGRIESDGFDFSRLGLYDVHVSSWRGFVHICLADAPATDLHTHLGDEAGILANWPLESLCTVQRDVQPVKCNWKVFWENYSECYHCPRLHPELCRIMPTYRQAVINPADLPGWEPAFEGDTGLGRIECGKRTWTRDGRSTLPPIDGLSDTEIEAGVTFASFTPSMFIVAHPDYVRTVRLVPTGPETLDLIAEWLLPPGSAGLGPERLEPVIEFPRMVMQQDAQICELNQRGLHSMRHDAGVLVAQEYALWDFHDWLRKRLGT